MAGDICRKINEVINSRDFLLKHRVSNKDFIRNRKMPFRVLVIFILRLIKQSIQKEIVDFFQSLGLEYSMSKSAFCQSRLKLKPEAFIELNDCLCNTYYTENEIQTWKGHRLIGIDGSTMQLPDSVELEKVFGYQRNQTKKRYPLARITTCFDLLNEIIIDMQIDSFHTGEYAMAVEHLEKLSKGDVVIFDRGFGAVWLFYLLFIKGIEYIIRIPRSQFVDFWQEKQEMSRIVTIEKYSNESRKQLEKYGITFKAFKIRLVKVILDTGETEVLVTSLLDEEENPQEIFKELYFKRWGIEGEYNHLKNHIEVENFSGKSEIAIKQDFYASAFLENLRSVFSKEAAEELKLKKKRKKLKYEYKINRNLSLGFIREELIHLFMSGEQGYIEKIKQLFIIEPVPIRKNRKNVRNFHISMKKFHMNNRRVL